MNFFVILLTILSFLSISVFEVAVILGLIYVFVVYLRKKKSLKGELSLPLLVHAIPTLLSTLIYAPHLLNKALERSVFLFLYTSYWLHIAKLVYGACNRNVLL